jgi:MFS family permease
MEKKLSAREWVALILIGLAGQLAWAIENNYINMWVYSQTKNASYINWMTYASAIAATLTTFFMGVLSDRLGKRKIFISAGYTIWGLSVFVFGLLSYQNNAGMFGASGAALGVGIAMVIWDCVMTFFGSTANDACFNARVTDVTNEHNRGKVESVLSVLPLFATIAVVLVAGLLGANSVPSAEQASAMKEAGLDSTNAIDAANFLAKPWLIFFGIFGAIVTVVGITSFFLLTKDEIVPNHEGKYWSRLFYGFRPSVMKEHKRLYIALLSFLCFNCAINAFMPYYMVYMQNSTANGGLNINGSAFTIDVGLILLIASIIVIVIGLFMDKIGKNKVLIPGVAIAAVGFVLFFFGESVNQTWYIIIAGIVMMAGYLIGTAVLGAIVRDETPKEDVGLFQGVRMIFVVLIPMIIGPLVTQLVCKYGPNNTTYYDPIQGNIWAPNRAMFLVSLGFMILAVAPIVWLLKTKEKEPVAPSDTTKAQ